MEREVTADWSVGTASERNEGIMGEKRDQADTRKGQGIGSC